MFGCAAVESSKGLYSHWFVIIKALREGRGGERERITKNMLWRVRARVSSRAPGWAHLLYANTHRLFGGGRKDSD